MSTSWFPPTALNNSYSPDRVIVLQCEGETRNNSTLYSLYQAKHPSHQICVEKISRLQIQNYFYRQVDLDDVSEHSFIVVCFGEGTKTEEYTKRAFIKKYSISSILKPTSYSSSSSSSSYASSSLSSFDFSSLFNTPSTSDPSPTTCSSKDSESSSVSKPRKRKRNVDREKSRKYVDIAKKYINNQLQPLYDDYTGIVKVKTIYDNYHTYCKKVRHGRCHISVFREAVVKCMPNASLSPDNKTFYFTMSE